MRVVLKAAVFRRLLAQRNVTIRAFARDARVSPRSLYALLAGHPAGPDLRAKLLAALDVPFDALFTIVTAKARGKRRAVSA